MSDIVKVLRGKYALDYDEKTLDQFCNEAADEIEKLRAALQTARRDALEEAARVAEHCDHPWVEAREAEHEAAALMAGTIAAAIRALKGEGDE